MFTAEPNSTKFDVHFSIAKVPVRVHPLFWLISLGFGIMSVPPGIHVFVGVCLWAAAVFVSILVHELGHALVARAYGWPPRIVLHGFGGLALFSPTRQSRTERILISFMGPGAGFIFGGLILAAIMLTGHSTQLLPGVGPTIGSGPRFAFSGARLELFTLFLVYVNIFWGLINLLPVYPLDGGDIAKAILEKVRPRDSWSIALKLSMAAAIVVAIAALALSRQIVITIMFGYLAYTNYQMLQQIQSR